MESPRLVFPGRQTRRKLERRLLRWRSYPLTTRMSAKQHARAMDLLSFIGDPRKLGWNALRHHYAAVVRELSQSFYDHALKEIYTRPIVDALSGQSTTYALLKKHSARKLA
mgnify:CR=1 FL=1